jgi:hypothetical protein
MFFLTDAAAGPAMTILSALVEQANDVSPSGQG